MADFEMTPVTFTGEEVREVKDFVFEKKHKDIGKIDVGLESGVIKAKKQIVKWGDYPDTGQNEGGCDEAVNVYDFAPTQKFWDPNTISENLKFCPTQVYDSMFNYLNKGGIEKFSDPNQNALVFLVMNVAQTIPEAAMRNIWFGDKAINATFPPLDAAADIPFFDKVDGLFKQIRTSGINYTLSGTNPNDGATYVLQQTFTGANVITWLDDILALADSKITDSTTHSFRLTRLMLDKLDLYMGDTTHASKNQNLTRVVGNIGSREYIYRGFTIKEMSFQDRIIKKYMKDGTTWYKPNRILFADFENNLRCGFSTPVWQGAKDTTPNYNIRDWNMRVDFDPITNNWYVKYNFDVDAKLIVDNEVIIGE